MGKKDISNQHLAERITFRHEDAYMQPCDEDIGRYNFIAVSAASKNGVPDAVLDRLKPGGCAIVPVATADDDDKQEFIKVRRAASGKIESLARICEARFV